MSSDQRPAKVRVFSGRDAAPIPSRRRGDTEARELTQQPAPIPAPIVQEKPARNWALMLGLFAIGSAIGGVLVALFGLSGNPFS